MVPRGGHSPCCINQSIQCVQLSGFLLVFGWRILTPAHLCLTHVFRCPWVWLWTWVCMLVSLWLPQITSIFSLGFFVFGSCRKFFILQLWKFHVSFPLDTDDEGSGVKEWKGAEKPELGGWTAEDRKVRNSVVVDSKVTSAALSFHNYVGLTRYFIFGVFNKCFLVG